MEGLPRVYRIRAVDAVTIPTISEMMVPGKILSAPHINQGLIEGTETSLCDDSLLHRLVHNPAQGILLVRMVNFSNEEERR